MKLCSRDLLKERLDALLAEPVSAAQERARTAFDNEVKGFNNRFVLLGAGNMGRRILARLRQDGIEPLTFADNQRSQWGKNIDGLDVLAPEEAAARYGHDAVFIVTIYNNSHSFPETRSQLSGLGCFKTVSVIPLRWKYHETFLPYFRDDLPHKVLLQKEAINAAYGLWSDDRSLQEYVAQVAWRLNGEFDVLGKPDTEGEYFPAGIIRSRPDELFVDVGAYDGDTIRKFIDRYDGKFRKAIGLEPDPQNYRKLVQFLSGIENQLASRIEALPLAASNRACRLRFRDGEGLSAALSDQGSIEVECVRLDDLLRGEHPTYIKLDIEGAELDAIEGCQRVLVEERPVLAACVYHLQDHLWKIPIAVNRITPRNQFFLRPHRPECWDTVCYAVPAERALHS